MVLGIIFVLSAISKQNFSDDHGINDERIKFRDETQLKTANSEIMIITPENKTYIDPMGGYYPATYGFENDDDGAVAMDWSGQAIVESSYMGHNKVIKHTTYGWTDIRVNFNNQTSGTIEFYFNTDNINRDVQFNCYGYDPSGGTTRPIILGVHNGNFRRNDGSSWHALDIGTSFSVNTWYHVRIDFDCDTDTWNTSINGVLKSWDDPFAQGDSKYICDLRFYQFLSPVITRFDAIGFSWDPNYNIGNNGQEGLLLSFENTSTLEWMGYSLDGQTNKTILGNITIPFPDGGSHKIQLFGNNSIGTIYQSNARYFTRIWNLTGTPIFIDGNAAGVDAHNWTWVEQQDWFGGGDGSQGTPYIIEYITINGQGSGSCIFIRDSNKYFIVRNCKVYNGGGGTYDAGIKLQNTQNGIIMNNDCSNNLNDGILLYGCRYNTLSGNTVNNNNKNGIHLEEFCLENILLKNTIHNEIKMDYCIKLYHECNDNIISGNSLEYKGDGEFYAYAIYIDWDCFRNTITKNILDCEGSIWVDGGIYLHYSCEDHLFYLNYFYEYATSIRDEGINTQWDNGSIGNYWPVYDGHDDNNDGIGDVPYVWISQHSQDNFPIWDEHDPIITIHSPIDDEKVGRIAPSFNVTIYDPWLDRMWYTVDGGMNNHSFIHNETIDQTSWENQWDLLSNGAPIVIMFYANDTFGHMSNDNVTAFKYVPTTPSGNGGGGGGGDDDDKEGEAIPGYNIFILIGIFSVITIILIKRRLNEF